MPKRGENIYKRKDGRWEGRCICGRKENGKARYKSVYGPSYKETKEKLQQLKTEASKPTENCRIIFSSLCLEWLLSARNIVKPSTYARYELLVQKHIIPQLGSLRADQLTANKLSAFINAELNHGRLDGSGGLSAKTVCDICIVVRSIVRMGQVRYNLPNYISDVRLPKAPAGEVLTLADADLFRLEEYLFAVPAASNLGLLICLYTGIRLGEICALRWSDIDWASGTIHVCKSVERLPCPKTYDGNKTQLVIATPKTAKSNSVIPLPTKLINHLRQFAVSQTPNAFIATGQEEKIMDPRTYENRFSRLLQKLDIAHVKFHAMRHTFATRSIRSGMDAKCLSEILGHATVAMTLNRYVHTSLDSKRRQMERLDFSVA
ncbi:MAG: site-specific integrase [Clostridiales bacterium]|nr:site-specific integrase [Clostridiales bacterium]